MNIAKDGELEGYRAPPVDHIAQHSLQSTCLYIYEENA